MQRQADASRVLDQEERQDQRQRQPAAGDLQRVAGGLPGGAQPRQQARPERDRRRDAGDPGGHGRARCRRTRSARRPARGRRTGPAAGRRAGCRWCAFAPARRRAAIEAAEEGPDAQRGALDDLQQHVDFSGAMRRVARWRHCAGDARRCSTRDATKRRAAVAKRRRAGAKRRGMRGAGSCGARLYWRRRVAARRAGAGMQGRRSRAGTRGMGRRGDARPRRVQLGAAAKARSGRVGVARADAARRGRCAGRRAGPPRRLRSRRRPLLAPTPAVVAGPPVPPAIAARFPEPAERFATPAFEPGRTAYTTQRRAALDPARSRARSRRVRTRHRHRGAAARRIAGRRADRGAGVHARASPGGAGRRRLRCARGRVALAPACGGDRRRPAWRRAGRHRSADRDRPGARRRPARPRAGPGRRLSAAARQSGRRRARPARRRRRQRRQPRPPAAAHAGGRSAARSWCATSRRWSCSTCTNTPVDAGFAAKFGGGAALRRLAASTRRSPTCAPFVDRAAEEWFRAPLAASLAAAGLQHRVVLHRSAADPTDRKVSMGGVSPRIGRNADGLRNAVSLLVETRGARHRPHRSRAPRADRRGGGAQRAGKRRRACRRPRQAAPVRRSRRRLAGLPAARSSIEAAPTPSEHVLSMLDARDRRDPPRHGGVGLGARAARAEEPAAARAATGWRRARATRCGACACSASRCSRSTRPARCAARPTARPAASAAGGEQRRRWPMRLRVQTCSRCCSTSLPAATTSSLEQPLANLAVAALEPESPPGSRPTA